MGLLNLTLPSIGQPNATEDVDTVNSLSAIQTLVNGNLDELNVPNLAGAFTKYDQASPRAQAEITGGAAAGTYLYLVTKLSAANQAVAATPAVYAVLDLDPTLFAANSRQTKLNLRVRAVTNAVAPAVTFTTGLYPIATFGGGSGAGPSLATLGAVVAGSTAAVASPAASGTTPASSGDFNYPAAGAYAIAVVTSGTTAAGSVVDLIAQLYVRQV